MLFFPFFPLDGGGALEVLPACYCSSPPHLSFERTGFFFLCFPFFFFAFFDQAIGQLKPQGVEAHFVVATCENMVSEKAMRPGDILTASNGKTIEVLAPLALLLFLFYYL